MDIWGTIYNDGGGSGGGGSKKNAVDKKDVVIQDGSFPRLEKDNEPDHHYHHHLLPTHSGGKPSASRLRLLNSPGTTHSDGTLFRGLFRLPHRRRELRVTRPEQQGFGVRGRGRRRRSPYGQFDSDEGGGRVTTVAPLRKERKRTHNRHHRVVVVIPI